MCYPNGTRVSVKSGPKRKEYIGVISCHWREDNDLLYDIKITDTITIAAFHEEVTPIPETETKIKRALDKHGAILYPKDSVLYNKDSGRGGAFNVGEIISITYMGNTPYVLVKTGSSGSCYVPAETVIRCFNQPDRTRDYVNSGFFSGAKNIESYTAPYSSRTNASIYISEDIEKLLGDVK